MKQHPHSTESNSNGQYPSKESLSDMSTSEIRDEIRHTQSELEHTIEELRSVTSPEEVVQHVVAALKGGPGKFLANFGRTVRDNPIPTALSAVGLVWLASSSSSDDDYEIELDEEDLMYEPTTYAARSDELERNVDVLSSPMAGVPGPVERESHGYGSVRFDVGEDESSSLRDKSSELAGKARGKASEIGDKARGAAARATGTAKAKGRQAAQGARRAKRRVQSEFWEQLNENPMVLAAIGVAVGAAVGGGLPRTRIEDRRLGHLGDEARRKARSAARSEGEHLKEAAKDIGHEVKETARRATHEASREDTDTASAIKHELEEGAREIRHTAERHGEETRQRISEDTHRTPGESYPSGNWPHT